MVRALLLVLLVTILLPHTGQGQGIPGITQPGIQKKFTASVDQLDEFIDRFNHNDPMFLEAFPNRPKRPLSAERAFLVKTLLNPKSKLDPALTDGFIREVTNPAKPCLLNFTDQDWYATLACKLTLDGKPVTGRLVLRFEEDSNGVSAWRILSASAPWLDAEAQKMTTLPPPAARKRGLNPASHGNGFIALHRAFMSADLFAENLADSASRDARVLAGLVESNRLRLDRVTAVLYHFLQVNNFLFTVSDVNAPEGEPSGFLIGRIQKADAEAKRKYRKTVLHLEG